MRARREILALKLAIFDPSFVHIRQTSGDRAENFTAASSLQPQHMLQISAHLNVLGLSSTFEGGGP